LSYKLETLNGTQKIKLTIDANSGHFERKN